MKKLMFTILLLLLSNVLFCQQKAPAPVLSSQEYLQKSKKQKTTAWVLLGSGAALTVAGGVLFKDQFKLFTKNSGVGGAVMFTAGVAAMGTSIPFFIASARNKGKASVLAAGVKLEQQVVVCRQGFSGSCYPAFTVRVAFR